MAAALPLLVVLTGPTGTGKSDLALQLVEQLQPALALEIVSVDSALVYRGMDIGTAKPSNAARARVPHHLIDIRDPAQRYSAGDFVGDARAAIADVIGRGRVPLLVGGTMLYLRALRDGLAQLPPAAAAVRREIDAQAALRGWSALHAELARVDPQAAQRIAATDAQRIQRALEVFRLTGHPLSDLQRQPNPARDQFRWLRFALAPGAREASRARLAERFAAMLRVGFVEEVRALHARGDLTEEHPSMRAVGYRQLWQFCAGRVSLGEATQRAITATAQLAKRQMTWLRRDDGLIWLSGHDVGQLETLKDSILTNARA